MCQLYTHTMLVCCQDLQEQLSTFLLQIQERKRNSYQSNYKNYSKSGYRDVGMSWDHASLCYQPPSHFPRSHEALHWDPKTLAFCHCHWHCLTCHHHCHLQRKEVDFHFQSQPAVSGHSSAYQLVDRQNIVVIMIFFPFCTHHHLRGYCRLLFLKILSTTCQFGRILLNQMRGGQLSEVRAYSFYPLGSEPEFQ